MIFEKHLIGIASLLGFTFKSVSSAVLPPLFNVLSNLITAFLDEIISLPLCSLAVLKILVSNGFLKS